MATDGIPKLTLKFHQKMKPVVARFDAAHARTDGGALLLKALDERLTLTGDLSACLPDRRHPRKVQHELRDLLRQRVFGLACGYEDGTDAARLADDPMHKLAVGRDPLTRAALASQPTLSRFENAMGRGPSIGWAGHWPRRSSRSTATGSRAEPNASRSIWIRPMIPPTGSRN